MTHTTYVLEFLHIQTEIEFVQNKREKQYEKEQTNTAYTEQCNTGQSLCIVYEIRTIYEKMKTKTQRCNEHRNQFENYSNI